MNSKERFNEKIDQMKGEQAKNVKMFTDEEYQQKIERIKEVKMPGHKFAKNSRFHTGIGRSPFKAMFGADPSMGVEGLGVETEMLADVTTEEQLEDMFPQEACEATGEELLMEGIKRKMIILQMRR